ncbi:hypothetical protein OIE76_42150 (plasmid) [Streptomyces sp. NBC_01727]|nr:hypothetical protein OIE76_42150 [Streptomyces sp. NBC_01727]
MVEVALDDVQWDAGVEESGGLGVPESVGAVEVHQASGLVPDVEAGDELGEFVTDDLHGQRPVGPTVEFARQEHVPRPGAGEPVSSPVLVNPLLLSPDDRDDLGVHEDRVRRLVDFGLLVAELGDVGAFVLRSRGGTVQGQQRVAVEHDNLGDPPPRAGQQHQHVHDLRVAKSTRFFWAPKELDVRHDLAELAVADDVLQVGADAGALLVAASPSPPSGAWYDG